MRRLLVLILLSSLVSTIPESKIGDFPVIGILSLPYDGKDDHSEKTEYIDPYYSQYLNAAGAAVVPISFKLTEPELRTLMGKLNGVFFTGGSVDFVYYDEETKKYELTPYAKAGKMIFDIAKEMKKNDIHFPLWGTCLGFQLLAYLAAEDPHIPKEGCDCKDYGAPLYFTEDGHEQKGMFKGFSKEQMKDFTEQSLTYGNHGYYIDYLDFLNFTSLNNFFKVLAHSPDKGNTFVHVAAMEGKDYPFFGVQFHPELKQYNEVNRTTSLESIGLTHELANFFVNEARKCPHKMTRSEKIKRSIWNTPIYQPEEGKFLYLFP